MQDSARILVVDDEADVRNICVRTLLQSGYDVQGAKDGESALRQLNAQEFDIVLTDLAMPELINGEELTKEVRRQWPSTDVIIMTAYPSLETAVPTLKVGAFDYLIKPFSQDLLRAIIMRCLEKRRLSVDLNRERAMRQELEAAYSELQKVEHVKDAILSRLSHELRTPLCSGFMALDKLEAQGQSLDLCRALRSSLSRLQDTVDDLMLFAQAAQGDKVLNKKPLNPRKLIEDIVHAYRPVWREREIDVKTKWTGLETVIADFEKLKAAIKHLFLNAIYFSRKGGRVVIDGRARNDGAYISFSDTGIGIPRDKLPHLFDGFYQVAEHLTREVGGLGLGLAIVRRIAESHGGSIWVESEEGRGSTFVLKLPIESAAKYPAAAQRV